MNPFFNIETQSLQTSAGLSLKQVALVNSENNQILGIVTPKYKIIKNDQVANVFKNALHTDENEEIQDHFLRGGVQWRRRVILPREKYDFTILGEDTVGVCLEIFNSYDGKHAYGFNIFGYRWICQNGMISGRQNLFGETFTHMSNQLDHIRNSFAIKLDMLQGNVNVWKKWTEIKFTMKMMEAFLDSRKYLSKKGKERSLTTYEMVMNKEGHDETKWGAYNALTYVASNMVESRKADTSPIFSNAYRTFNRMASDLYTYDVQAISA